MDAGFGCRLKDVPVAEKQVIQRGPETIIAGVAEILGLKPPKETFGNDMFARTLLVILEQRPAPDTKVMGGRENHAGENKYQITCRAQPNR